MGPLISILLNNKGYCYRFKASDQFACVYPAWPWIFFSSWSPQSGARWPKWFYARAWLKYRQTCKFTHQICRLLAYETNRPHWTSKDTYNAFKYIWSKYRRITRSPLYVRWARGVDTHHAQNDGTRFSLGTLTMPGRDHGSDHSESKGAMSQLILALGMKLRESVSSKVVHKVILMAHLQAIV